MSRAYIIWKFKMLWFQNWTMLLSCKIVNRCRHAASCAWQWWPFWIKVYLKFSYSEGGLRLRALALTNPHGAAHEKSAHILAWESVNIIFYSNIVMYSWAWAINLEWIWCESHVNRQVMNKEENNIMFGRASTVYKGLYNWPNETISKQHKQCP